MSEVVAPVSVSCTVLRLTMAPSQVLLRVLGEHSAPCRYAVDGQVPGLQRGVWQAGSVSSLLRVSLQTPFAHQTVGEARARTGGSSG